MSKTTKKRLEHLNKYIEKEWEKYFWDFIMKHENKLKWSWLSQNPNITWDIIQNNLDKHLDWNWLSQNPNITWEIIQNNLDKPWNWNGISENPNITWDIIKNNLDKPWDWDYISQNSFEKEKKGIL